MKRTKKLYILLGVLVVICIATFALSKTEEKKEKAASLFLVCHKAADRADACCAGRFWILLFWRICGSDTADAP